MIQIPNSPLNKKYKMLNNCTVKQFSMQNTYPSYPPPFPLPLSSPPPPSPTPCPYTPPLIPLPSPFPTLSSVAVSKCVYMTLYSTVNICVYSYIYLEENVVHGTKLRRLPTNTWQMAIIGMPPSTIISYTEYHITYSMFASSTHFNIWKFSKKCRP